MRRRPSSAALHRRCSMPAASCSTRPGTLQVLHLRGSVKEVALTLRCADGSASRCSSTRCWSRRRSRRRSHRRASTPPTDWQYESEICCTRADRPSPPRRGCASSRTSPARSASAPATRMSRSPSRMSRATRSRRPRRRCCSWDERRRLRARRRRQPARRHGSADRLRCATHRVEIVVHADEVESEYPALAAGLRQARLESLSITPLIERDGAARPPGVLLRPTTRVRRAVLRPAAGARSPGLPDSRPRAPAASARAPRAARSAHRTRQPAAAAAEPRRRDRGIRPRRRAAGGGVPRRGRVQVDQRPLGHARRRRRCCASSRDRLRRGVRSGDIVGRIGGDEFVVICADADLAGGESIAERILDLSPAADRGRRRSRSPCR